MMELYSHRFIEPVFRLFQSELETCMKRRTELWITPELFNETTRKHFFKNHPYGQQTILGSAISKKPIIIKNDGLL